jgi:hypothetical protein
VNPENTQALIDIYPALFSDLSQRSCMYLFGFECGDGWFELLRCLIQDIKGICESNNLDIKINQIKEKYGTLRFYLSSETEELGRLIAQAEKESAHICEECGKPGSMREKCRWYSVKCDECWARN